MIAEYERAQILERSRRGKRHRAKQGQLSVLSGAPYGYRYVRKTEDRAAYYEVIDTQAEVVRQVFDLYTAQALSIGAITRRLNELAVPTSEHFDPVFFVLGCRSPKDRVVPVFRGFHYGTLSLRSFALVES